MTSTMAKGGLSGASLTPASMAGLACADDAVLALLPVGICVCDSAGVILRSTARFQALCSAALIGSPLTAALTADGAPDAAELQRAEALLARCLEGGEGGRQQVWLRGAERLHRVQLSCAPQFDPAGQPLGAVICAMDIGAEDDDAVALAERDRRFLEAIVETTPECIKVVGEDGGLLQMNRAGLCMIGADGFGGVHGRPVPDLIAPEHRAEWLDHHRRVCRGERLSWCFDIIGLNGERRHMETHATPLRLPSGRVAHLAVTRDISQRRRDELALRDSERHHKSVLNALPAAVYTTDAAGRITSFNEAAVRFSGRVPNLGSDLWCVSWRLYTPSGEPMAHDQCPMAQALRERRPYLGHEDFVAERPDGTRVPFLPFATPLFDDDGALVGGVNMLIDISERKRAESRQRTLIDELNHRVKNTLATVQSIALQTMRSSASLAEFQPSFEGRLQALSAAHDLLTANCWTGATLHSLVAAQGAVFGVERIDADGDAVDVSAPAALTLSMILHELGTNAVKHGALTTTDGRVTVRWTCDAERICLTWVESGGPPALAPARAGFGTRLVRMACERDLGGEAELDFLSSGLHVRLRVPSAGNLATP